jgi:peptidoglycan/LPS O-acetylase OafA/YrhL
VDVATGVTTAPELLVRLDRMDRSAVRKTAAVMGFVAVTLFIASALHMFGDVHGNNTFDPNAAGIAEAIIGIVLASAAALMVQEPERARRVGMGGVGFAIAGFGVGLTRTIPSGHVWEIAYHVVVLPILIATFISLARSGRTRGARRAPVAG